MSVASSALAASLRRLYFTRFAFAFVWAALVIATASDLGPAAVALLVLYPLFDVAAAIVDARAAKATGSVLALYVNVAVSLLAAAGVAVTATSGIPGVLRVWGSWAIVSGLAQLAVGISRRRLGGQWPMILSGGLSVIAGTSFVLQAGRDGASLAAIGGYAVLGGVFFLVSALRLGTAAKKAALSAGTV
ncbi:hypothetical protein [Amycolatopsis jiangsuensis]|uniref:Uncharacterized membrane protein HdeD (DUF308 family) n=1 Tax=Amycolatopsis jiangsuensis TaxID=1181879 RepID=A0A840IS56_9PSEU|nr:hypothetical protein [Amycolatopsis jiangsuensis]MBB4684379.1 uncharacterized membrane protein HdeD (DUF308 family) [Amycolatopsis jiangsuensis]